MTSWRIRNIGNMGTFCLVVAALALFMIPLASSAGAQDSSGDRSAAKKFYKQGKVLYDAGNYTEAKKEFELAYEAQPHPVVLKSIAECIAALGDALGAIEILEKALAKSDDKGKPDIENRIAKLNEKIVSLDVTSDPPAAAISIDGEETAKMTPATFRLNPGDYNITFTLDGYAPISKSASLVIGTVAYVSIDFQTEGVLIATPADDAIADTDEQHVDEVEDDKEGLPTGFWISAAVTGVGLVSGSVFGAMALGTQKDFESSVDDNNPDKQLSNTGKTQAVLSDVSFGIAAAGAIVGTIILITHSKKETDATGAKLNIVPVAGRKTFGINAVIEF